MAEKKSRWGKKKDVKDAPPAPVLPVRRTEYDLPEAVCVGVENFFTFAECENYMRILRDELDWMKQTVQVGGKDHGVEVAEPRRTLFMSDPGICYEYSGRENVGVGWHPTVLEIKQRAEKALVDECGLPAVSFNSVQLNRYDGPKHALGFHADNEPDLARGEPIASVSFGVSRDFVIMDREDNSRKWIVPLADGTFFCMGGKMQQRYLHGVPPGGDAGLRINLTFRVCIPREAGHGPAAASRRSRHEEESSGYRQAPAPSGPPRASAGGYADAAPALGASQFAWSLPPGKGGGKGGKGTHIPVRSGTPGSILGGGGRWAT